MRSRDVGQKKTGKCGNFEKTGGGVYPNPTSIFFTVFNMGDLPKINGKIRKKFPNRGEGGGPRLGKNSHIFLFVFLATSLKQLKRCWLVSTVHQSDFCMNGIEAGIDGLEILNLCYFPIPHLISEAHTGDLLQGSSCLSHIGQLQTQVSSKSL